MEELFSRNIGLLTETEQERLSKLSVGIAGCGMGSVVASALVRLGVENFVIADGDVVEIHNLNRQAFSWKHIGEKKAGALAEILKGINPQAKISVWEMSLTPQNVPDFVDAVDLVVDCIDLTQKGLAASIIISQRCQGGKWYLYPLDIGWGARLYVFPPTSKIELGDLLGVTQEDLGEAEGVPFELLGQAFSPVLPYMDRVFEELREGKLRNYPQPVSSTLTAALLVVEAVVKIVRGEIPRSAPDYYAIDPTTLL